MKLLFIGGYYPQKHKELFVKQSKVGLDFAAHNLQEALFKGFDENNLDYTVLNAPFLGSFPFFNKLLFVPPYFSDNRKIRSISYVNLLYYKRLDIRRKIKCQIFKWCQETEKETNRTIFLYNFSTLPLTKKIKKSYPDIKIVLLVTDLPEYMAADNKLLTRLNTKISNVFEKKDDNKLYKNIDAYMLLSSYMQERLPIEKRPCIIIEGIYNPSEDNIKQPVKESYKTILYTGNLGKRYGILDLLECFSRIENENYRLWICGTGEALDDVKNYQQMDTRIKYFGMLSREDVIFLQKQATILINPRHSRDEYTKYSFPSKTMEYMASGTPTLMSRLACLPDDYESFLYLFDDESIDGMKLKILEVCEKSNEELNDFGKRAKLFINSKKTPAFQCEKIIEFLSHL